MAKKARIAKKATRAKRAAKTPSTIRKTKVASGRRLSKKKSTTSKSSPSLRLAWDLAELMKAGLPSNEKRSDAYVKIVDEGVSLTWVCEMLTQACGRAVSKKQVTDILARKGIPFIRLHRNDQHSSPSFSHLPLTGHAAIVRHFDFPGNPKKGADMISDTYLHPRGLAVLEKEPAFAAIAKNKEWITVKKSRRHIR